MINRYIDKDLNVYAILVKHTLYFRNIMYNLY